MAQPRTIYDFPDQLCAVDYPAPGDRGMARKVVDLLEPTWVGHDSDIKTRRHRLATCWMGQVIAGTEPNTQCSQVRIRLASRAFQLRMGG